MAKTTERRRHKLTSDGMEEILRVWDEDDVDEEEIIEFQRRSPELVTHTDGDTVIRDRDGSSPNGFMNEDKYDGLNSGQQRQRNTIGGKIGLFYETGSIFVAFFGLGIAVSILGPTLLDLACHTHSKLEDMSFIFTSRSVGYLTGSLVGGWLYDKFNKLRVMSLSCLLVTLFMWVSPFSENLYVLMLLVSAMAIAAGSLDTGGNVLILELWQEKSRPYIQVLHFAFAVGAFISPLLAKPFLLPTFPQDSFTNTSLSCNRSYYGDVLPVTWGYWIGSIPLLVSGVAFLVSPCFESCSTKHIKIQKYITDEVYAKSKVFKYTILLLFCVFLLLYVGFEIAYGGYIFAFATFNMSKGNAAYLTSVFWGSFAFGRFISIPISRHVTSSRMLICDLIGCFIGSTILISQFSKGCSSSGPTQLWLGTILLGLAMASVFPCAINLAESLISLSGRTASALIVGACFGEMLIPLLVGVFFVQVGPCFLMYSAFIISLLTAVVYVVIEVLGRRWGSSHNGVVHYHKKSTHAQSQPTRRRTQKEEVLRLLEYSGDVTVNATDMRIEDQ